MTSRRSLFPARGAPSRCRACSRCRCSSSRVSLLACELRDGEEFVKISGEDSSRFRRGIGRDLRRRNLQRGVGRDLDWSRDLWRGVRRDLRRGVRRDLRRGVRRGLQRGLVAISEEELVATSGEESGVAISGEELVAILTGVAISGEELVAISGEEFVKISGEELVEVSSEDSSLSPTMNWSRSPVRSAATRSPAGSWSQS